MTLSEGIAQLMSSDPINNALVHESWNDGSYIQCAPLEWGKDDLRIQVFSRVDENLDYTERPFKRKDFARIKDSGWHVISSNTLIIYITKQQLRNQCDKSDEQYSEDVEPYLDDFTEEDKAQAFEDIADDIKLYQLSKDDLNFVKEHYEMFLISFKRDKMIQFGREYAIMIESGFDDYFGKLIKKSERPELYKNWYHLGLTREDLEWIHNIELKNGILIETDDLEDFDNVSAVNVVKRRITNAMSQHS